MSERLSRRTKFLYGIGDTGVSVLLFDEMTKRAQAKGYKWIDLSLTSEDNPYTPVLATRLRARLCKRYRVYRLGIEQQHAPREA